MAHDNTDAAPEPGREEEPAADLAIPAERRSAAKAHAALLSRTAARVAAKLPLTADVEDFRRILLAEAKP
jgi:hypothetical protein